MSSAIERRPSEFDELRGELSRFDPLALASAIAGLQAQPSSARFFWRLSVLATLAAEMPRGGEHRQLDRADLERLLNEGPLAERAAIHEDPLDSPLSEELGFFGGSYLVGGGLAEDGVFVFRHMARGFLLAPKGLPDELVSELGKCGAAALQISHWALRAAGLTPYLAPDEEQERVPIPPADRLVELQKAMAFDPARLAGLSAEAIGALEPLVLDVGSRAFSDRQVNDGIADAQPFLRSGDWLICSRPFDVVTALRHHYAIAVGEAVGPGRPEYLFGGSLDSEVIEGLRRMGLARPQLAAPRGAGVPFSEIRAEADVGRRVIALVLADDFEGLDPRHPYSGWDATRHSEAIDGRITEIEAELAEAGEEGLCLLIAQPAGRPTLMPLLSAESPALRTLTLTAANLDTISVLETASPLGLWKFAESENALREQSRINTSSLLDIYGAYRDKERTFSSLRGLDGASFFPGLSGGYRCEAAAIRNRHGASDIEGHVREVERKEFGVSLSDRLHYEAELDTERLRIHVAGAPLALWVHGPSRDPSRSIDAVQSVAYWLAELCEPLEQLLTELAGELDALQIEIDFEPWEYWFEGGEDPGGEEIGAALVPRPGVIALSFGPALRRGLPQARNDAERELIALMIDSLGQAAEKLGVAPPSPELAAEARERVAPPGFKKHLLMLPAENNPLLAEADGPIRSVQEADLSAARDLLADALDQRFELRGKPVPTEQRAEVLKTAVDALLEGAYEVLEGFDSEGLLEILVAENERVIAQAEHRRVCLPVRLATYPQASETLREESLEASLAGICCRFLIERATAIPPQGSERWSLASHDRAMGLVAEALTWADLYDAIRGGLSSVDLLIRKDDGWLRLVESDPYDTGRSRYYDSHLSNETRRSHERWEDRFARAAEDPGGNGVLARFDEPMLAEAGVTLSRLGETLVAARQIAFVAQSDLVVMARGDAAEAIASQLIEDVEPEEIEQAIAYLGMGPREEFLKPAGGGKNDVYPWLFARRWSYNRRPFLFRKIGDREEILWGQRQVIAALHILGGQIGAAQYAKLASAPELIGELGRLGDELGSDFEAEVAARVAELGLPFRANVEKLGTSTLQRNASERLGDIDVLVADPDARILWAVECKALRGSLSSSEVVREMSSHFGQEGGNSIAKHGERAAWLGDCLEGALELLELPVDPEGWEVRGLFCAKRETIAPYIEEMPFDLVAIDELAAYLKDPPEAREAAAA